MFLFIKFLSHVHVYDNIKWHKKHNDKQMLHNVHLPNINYGETKKLIDNHPTEVLKCREKEGT